MNTETQLIRLEAISVPPRLRVTDMAHVEQLALSIEDRGLLAPIQVRQADANGQHALIAGAHRLEAVRSLGRNLIPAFVLAVDEREAKLIEIEENLVRHDLTELDRSVFLAEWKAIYVEISGAQGRGHSAKKAKNSALQLVLPFSEAVRERLKLGRRSVDIAVRRATAIAGDVRRLLAGTWIADHGAQLDALAKLDPALQRKVAALIVQPSGPRSVAAAVAQARGERAPVRDVDAEQLRRLNDAWRKAGAKARAVFLKDLVDLGVVKLP